MNRTQQLRDLGQSLWLDNITRTMLDDGGLRRYIEDFSVTGLTSNPTIFDTAIGNSGVYDAGIREKTRAGKSGEALFMELALEDLRRAADLFRPIFDATDGVDGWVSMRRRIAQTCSSKSPVRRKGFPRSRNLSSPAFRSTSPCCSRASNILPPPRRTCGASSGASPAGSIRA